MAKEQTADDFLLSGGVRSAQFGKKQKGMSPVPGTTEHGLIVEPPELMQKRRYAPGKTNDGELLFWDDEKTQPQLQLVVKIQCDYRVDDDDDGIRAIYVSGQLKAVTAQAVKAAGAKKLEVGGHLYVRFDEQIINNDGFKQNIFSVRYDKPAEPVDNFFDEPSARSVPDAAGNVANIPAGSGGMLGRLQQQAAATTANQSRIRANAGFDEEPPF